MVELYRAVRLYINYFQPSMKLKKKFRESSKVQRIYHEAQTPFQRLLAAKINKTKKIEKFKKIYNALDPIRLLKQLEILQDALWQHTILFSEDSSAKILPQKAIYDLSFNVNECGVFEKNQNNDCDSIFIIKPDKNKHRKYRRIKKTRTPHWWRTRKDPFETVWEEICKILENEPERTATSILKELQKFYPGQYQDDQLRTLQRRVQKWRANAIIAFDDNWIDKEIFVNEMLPKNLSAFTFKENPPFSKDSAFNIQ